MVATSQPPDRGSDRSRIGSDAARTLAALDLAVDLVTLLVEDPPTEREDRHEPSQ